MPAAQSSGPSSSRPSSPASFSAFVGTWDGHGRRLVISGSGAVRMDFRTYVNCTAKVTTACDRLTADTITDGGHVRGRITAVDNASTVQVTVDSTSVPRDVPLGTFTLGHDIARHALAARVGPFATDAPFCGPGAPLGYCGA